MIIPKRRKVVETKMNISSSEGKRDISLERRFSLMSSSVPFNVSESKWQEFAWEQFLQHLIAFIREEIIGLTTNLIDSHQAKGKMFEFAIKSFEMVSQNLFEWMSLKLEQPHSKHSKHNILRTTMHPIVDTELQSLAIDSWTCTRVARTFAQELPSFRKCSSAPLLATTEMKPILKNHEETE